MFVSNHKQSIDSLLLCCPNSDMVCSSNDVLKLIPHILVSIIEQDFDEKLLPHYYCNLYCTIHRTTKNYASTEIDNNVNSAVFDSRLKHFENLNAG